MSRRRRVVAPPTRLGASEEGDLTALAPARAAPRPAASDDAAEPSRPTPLEASRATDPVLPNRAPGDSDEAWGDSADSDRDLVREKPPHWQ